MRIHGEKLLFHVELFWDDEMHLLEEWRLEIRDCGRAMCPSSQAHCRIDVIFSGWDGEMMRRTLVRLYYCIFSLISGFPDSGFGLFYEDNSWILQPSQSCLSEIHSSWVREDEAHKASGTGSQNLERWKVNRRWKFTFLESIFQVFINSGWFVSSRRTLQSPG